MFILRSFFSMCLLATFLLCNSLSAGELKNDSIGFASQAEQLIENINGNIQTAVRPPQWSSNQLAFTFDASQQSNASGTFTGYITFPNQTRYAVNGTIGIGGAPVTLEVGPPSQLGNYVLTFVVTSLTGSIDHAQGPYGTAQNLTNGDQLQTTFNVSNIGDQASGTFMNR